ncbi:MAG TPA: 50S ribosomal protein L17 [Vicinamibacterales bacterium]|nr:50S ribosomal protein L17 [Vicinamibacterales bacterium]
MRHRVGQRKLGRVTEHRIAMLRNQAQALIRHERIETTVPRAKELRPFVERLITIAKRGLADGNDVRIVTARRLVARDIHDNAIVAKLFDTIAPRFAERPGGYTRLLKLGFRRGDSAEVAQVELVGSEYNPKAEQEAREAAEKPKAKGVGGRLRAAAERLRGSRKDQAEESADAAEEAAATQAKAAKAKKAGPRGKAKTGGAKRGQ